MESSNKKLAAMRNKNKDEYINTLVKTGNSLLAILLAFAIGGIMVVFSGENPFSAYGVLLKGAFGSGSAWINTIRYAIPIVLLAFSFALCDRCGYFNISQESQMYSSALMMVMVSEWTVGWPTFIRVVLIILSACVAGAVACLIPAIAKFKLGVSEIVVGVMMNYLMAYLNKHMIAFSFIAKLGGASMMSYEIPEHMSPSFIFITVVIIIAIYQFMMRKTIPGYRLTVVGKNPVFSEACGIPSVKVMLTSAALGGLLVGICTVGEMLGYYHIIYADFAANIGFNGMTAALLGSGGPIGMVLGAVLLGALKSGSVLLAVLTSVPTELVDCVQGFVMFFATISIINPKWFIRSSKASKKEV